ncbi:MAG: metal-dependent transcriptional regulator [Anaerolineales bacterium]|jgi:DtxR family Mn-dependent transcriptional regulator
MYNPLIALLLGLLFVVLVLLLFWPNGGLIGRWQRMRRMSTRVLREDALKSIHKAEIKGRNPNLQSVAGALNISTNQAASLLAEMEDGELVQLQGDSLALTPAGRDYALRVIRAHRLWERYLSEETGFNESDWHDQAERFEHTLTLDEADALSAQLGHPTHDPHGDPIPTANGEMIPHKGQPLTSLDLDKPARIVHIEDEPDTVYAQIVAEGLYPGMEVRLVESKPQRVRFWANADEHLLAPIVAANISVMPIPEEVLVEEPAGEQLSALRPGESGVVVNISPRCRGVERRRMMDLGILPGTTVKAEMVSPSGDPKAYRIRDALIALRLEQAQLINISRTTEIAS